MRDRIFVGAISLLAGWTSVICSAQAQTAPIPTPQGFESPSGLSAFGFDYFARAQLGIGPTSNVRLDPTQKNDVRDLATFDGVARSNWSTNALAFTVNKIEQAALNTKGQTVGAASGTVSGRLDISDNLKLRMGLLSQQSIVGQNDPNQFSGNLNGVVKTNTLEAGLDWTGGSNFASLQSRYQMITNNNTINVSDLPIIQSMNRNEANLTLQLGNTTSWGKYYVLAGPEAIHYTGSANILTQDRNSTGMRAGVGVEFTQGDLSGVVRAIGFSQKFASSAIPSPTSMVGIANLTYKFQPEWSAAVTAQRLFDEINIEGSAGLFTNLIGVAAQYQPISNFYIKAGPTYRYYTIDGTPYTAHSTSLDSTAAWQITKHVELAFNGRLLNEKVNNSYLSNLQYTDSEATFSLVVTY